MPTDPAHLRTIAGRVAVVTGAASGMGRATARLFAADGAHVAVVDRVLADAQAVVDEIAAAGGRAHAIGADLALPGSPGQAIREARDALGPIDILVNNAGISLPAPIDGPDFEAAWALTMAVNITAYTLTVREAVADLKRNGDGRIVNVASTEALGATAYMAPYTASKHAVVGFTRSLCLELGPFGVTANCICPGPINTGMTAPIPDEAKVKFARRRVPMRRYAEPEEVAHITLSVVLPASSFLTGAIIPVDGGLTVQNT
jgi:3-oxoacyl-[acyl-carrier protein] reductase